MGAAGGTIRRVNNKLTLFLPMPFPVWESKTEQEAKEGASSPGHGTGFIRTSCVLKLSPRLSKLNNIYIIKFFDTFCVGSRPLRIR